MKSKAKKTSNWKKHTWQDKTFICVNTIVMLFLVILCVYPFFYVLVASFSDPTELSLAQGFILWPQGFSLQGYEIVVNNMDVWTGYANTLFYVVVGTALQILFTATMAYGLSKRKAYWVSKVTVIVMITMFFSGGMIPGYLNVQRLGLLNTRWSIILPGLISVYNMMILRTAFQGIPESLEESAKIDGAGEFRILFRIVLPLSMSTIAVLILYYGVGHWNSWFNAMIYLRDRTKFPLQLFLREILINTALEDEALMGGTGKEASLQEVVKYSTTIVATLPILCAYPFLQRYFVKGVMIGAVKG